MGCPRGATIASAALLYLAYYLRCCVKDLAVRSPAVGALAANRMPAYLYRSNNDTKLLAHLARAAAAGADEPAFLAPACASGPPSFNALVKARMARDRRPVLAALTDKLLVKRWADLRGGIRTPEVLFSSKTCAVPDLGNVAYAFKATHTTGCLVLVEGGRVVGHKPCGERRLAPGSRATPEVLAALCARWTRTMYDVTQWAYSKLTPGVVAERLVYRGDGATPADDVKCFAFRGRTALVQHVAHRFDVQSGRPRSARKRDTFHDPRSGRRLPVAVDGQPAGAGLAPARVRQAREGCDGLARGLDFARIDLFDAGASFFLGEVTVYPKRGEHAFEPSAVDGELGRAWCRQGNATR